MRSLLSAIASLLAFALVLAVADPAAHAGEGPAADVAPATTRVYYGWQNLGVDGASVGLLVLGAEADRDNASGLLYSALGGYLLGAPLVHALHGHYGRAAGSFALRAGLPLAFGMATSALIGGGSGGGDIEDGIGMLVGTVAMGAVGGVIAIFVDDVGLSWDEKPAAPSWTPTVQPSPYGMTFGVAGAF